MLMRTILLLSIFGLGMGCGLELGSEDDTDREVADGGNDNAEEPTEFGDFDGDGEEIQNLRAGLPSIHQAR